MKANEFVRKHGLVKAIEVVKNKPPMNSSRYRARDNKYSATISTGESVSTIDLKRLVESHELVNEFFNLEALGFDKAIELAKKQIEELEDNETVEFWHRWDDDLSCTVARMKQAIADVESCMEVKGDSGI